MKSILLGTTNAGKVLELQDYLSKLPFQIESLTKKQKVQDPEETGRSFEENAEIKAAYYSKAFSVPVIADDSGLEVPVLGNKPGVFSARFAGPDATDLDNNAKLLHLLERIEGAERAAKFRCAMTISLSNGRILHTVSASCDGTISRKPFGTNGFGYDPLFIPAGHEKTFGELPDSTKRELSHRSKATKKLAEYLLSNMRLVT